ncbi:TolC family protein, partial [bacterium]|nr:TolC family protein [bacterium]
KGKNWIAGVMLKWEIFKGWDNLGAIQKSSAQLRNAKINYDKTLQNNRAETAAALRKVVVMQKKEQLTKESVQQAGESLRIISDRYAKGLEKTSDLLMAEATLSNARLNHLQALFGYNVSIFFLDFLLKDEK